jgi:hypothetical protein
LRACLTHDEPIVREHAEWALARHSESRRAGSVDVVPQPHEVVRTSLD